MLSTSLLCLLKQHMADRDSTPFQIGHAVPFRLAVSGSAVSSKVQLDIRSICSNRPALCVVGQQLTPARDVNQPVFVMVHIPRSIEEIVADSTLQAQRLTFSPTFAGPIPLAIMSVYPTDPLHAQAP